MVELFNRSRLVITEHFSNVFNGGELIGSSVARKNQITDRIANCLEILNKYIGNSGFPNFVEMI